MTSQADGTAEGSGWRGPFRAPKNPDTKLVYDWFTSARRGGSDRPRAVWGKAWELYFDDGTTIGRLDD